MDEMKKSKMNLDIWKRGNGNNFNMKNRLNRYWINL